MAPIDDARTGSSNVFAPVDGITLASYAAVCRALVRTAAGSAQRVDAVLSAHGLTPEGWDRISARWSERIRRDRRVHSEFGRLYAAAAGETGSGTAGPYDGVHAVGDEADTEPDAEPDGRFASCASNGRQRTPPRRGSISCRDGSPPHGRGPEA